VVEICTQYAQKGMFNIFLGVFFSTLAFAFIEPFFFIGYLISIAMFGLFQAIFMANAGGAWDNAKKIVETELKMKGTELHAASVVGDTVGDPFKDTSSVAMNPVIKFTTLFGLLAVELGVYLSSGGSGALSRILSVAFFLAALLFIRRVAVTTTVSQVTPEYVASGQAHILQDKRIPPYAVVFRIHGPFLFGTTDKIAAVTRDLEQLPPIVILRLRNMTAIDATGVRALEDLAAELRAAGRTLILCGAREQPAAVMRAAAVDEQVGPANVCGSIEAALKRAAEVHEAASSRGSENRL